MDQSGNVSLHAFAETDHRTALSEIQNPLREFIRGLDGKARYFMPLRIRLYREMTDWLKRNAPGVLAYYCMEDETVWTKTFGFVPEEKGGLPAMLDRSAARVCGLETE